jgi:hypothetical protein
VLIERCDQRIELVECGAGGDIGNIWRRVLLIEIYMAKSVVDSTAPWGRPDGGVWGG